MSEQDHQAEAFMRLANAPHQREMHELRVLARQGRSWTVAAREEGLVVEIGAEVTLFFELRYQFVQQAGRVTVLHDDVAGIEFEIELVGAPFSAENRGCYRVLTLLTDQWLQLGGEGQRIERCQIVDISATGCAIIAEQKLEISQIIKAVLTYGDIDYRGFVSVQSVSELSRGRIRYGVHCLEIRDRDQNLGVGLRLLSMAAQREQLRRLSGAA